MGFYKELGDRLEKWLKEKIKVVDTKVESITKYQKYVNTELDYCQLSISNTINTYKLYENPIFNFDTLVYGNNMEYDLTNHSISLKAGKTYNITVNCMLDDNDTYVNYRVYNMNTGEKLLSNINIFGCIWGKEVSGTSNSDIDFIYKCDEDCEIIIKSDMPSSNTAVTLRYAVLTVQEINRQITIDPAEYINSTQGLEDTPVGHIIAHMGTIAPKHYLICDGAEYNIADYPYLAQHIEDNFGSISYFGGDGETTFCVPDLRGEFLRGTGNNGAAVGVHQEGTEHPRIAYSSKYNYFQLISGIDHEYFDGRYVDKYVMLSEGVYVNTTIKEGTKTNDVGVAYTSRPTNTSVLYCIKYEPTYFMNTYNTNYMQPNMYSEEERIVGCWIDGKPLYEKVVKVTMPNKIIGTSTPHGIENLDILTNFSLNWYDSEDKAWYDRFRMWISSSTNYSISNELNIDSKNINITPNGNNIIDWSSRTTNAFCKLQYTKTTDEENSFTNDMVKDYIVRDDAQIVEMRKEIDELKAIVETLQTSTLSI